MIIGAGFGGLQCAKALRDEPVDVLLVDQQQLPPLHAAALPGGELPAEPVGDRGAVAQGVPRRAERPVTAGRGRRTSTSTRRACTLADGARARRTTTCVLATGSVTNFYGNATVEQHALGLKDLGEALQLRNHVLDCLERAATRDRRRRAPPAAHVLHRRRRTDRRGVRGRARRVRAPRAPAGVSGARAAPVRIILLEGGDRLLPTFKPRLSAYARRSSSAAVSRCGPTRWSTSADDAGVVLHDGTEIRDRDDGLDRGRAPPTWCIPSATHGHARRIEVDDHFRVVGRRAARTRSATSPRAPTTTARSLPMLVAARDAGRPLRRRARSCGGAPGGRSATATRACWPPSAAGRRWARSGRSRFTGFIGWLVWLVVHLYYLIGFENRLQRAAALGLVLRAPRPPGAHHPARRRAARRRRRRLTLRARSRRRRAAGAARTCRRHRATTTRVFSRAMPIDACSSPAGAVPRSTASATECSVPRPSATTSCHALDGSSGATRRTVRSPMSTSAMTSGPSPSTARGSAPNTSRKNAVTGSRSTTTAVTCATAAPPAPGRRPRRSAILRCGGRCRGGRR